MVDEGWEAGDLFCTVLLLRCCQWDVKRLHRFTVSSTWTWTWTWTSSIAQIRHRRIGGSRENNPSVLWSNSEEGDPAHSTTFMLSTRLERMTAWYSIRSLLV